MNEIFEVKVEMKLVVTSEDIDDIMVTALEGGITYWCCKAEVIGQYLGEYASEQISRNGTLRLYDMEQDERYLLTRYKLLEGIAMYVANPCSANIVEQIDGEIRIDTCNVDAEVADAIIQLALFGEVVYG